ncbi:MAG: hypothetical protein PV362_13995 [Providencia heimbachae]|nr:hypothetical protein [Providencia heimbachae]
MNIQRKDMLNNKIENAERNIDYLIHSLSRESMIISNFEERQKEIINQTPDSLKKYVNGVLNKIKFRMESKITSQSKEIGEIIHSFYKEKENSGSLVNNKYVNYGSGDLLEEIGSLNEWLNIIPKSYNYNNQELNVHISNGIGKELKIMLSNLVDDFNAENKEKMELIKDAHNSILSIKREYLNISLEEAMSQQERGIYTPSYSEPVNMELLSEQTADFKQSQEGSSTIENVIEMQDNSLITASVQRCMGRTAMCGITH